MLLFAAFELRLHLRSPTFWIVVMITFLMVVGSLTVERIQVGPFRDGPRNAAVGIVYVNLIWGLFFLFTATAFLTEAALRDVTSGFDAVLRATPANRRDLALGRFAGAFAAVLLAFLAVPLAALAAPWLSPGSGLPPTDVEPLLFGFGVLALPNLFLASALFMALASSTKSAMAAYLGAVALLILYGLSSDGREATQAEPLKALLEPFAFGAYVEATAGWSPAERAARLPALRGVLLWNRLLWTAVAGCCLLVAVRSFDRAREPSARPAPDTVDDRPAISPSAWPTPAFDLAARLSQLGARIALEVNLVLRSRFFLMVILLGLASAVASLSPISLAAWTLDSAGAVNRLDESFRLVPIVIAVFYAGELVWSERDRGIHEIIGAAPVSSAALLLPKLGAVILVLALTIAASAVMGAAMQAIRAGASAVDPSAWLAGYVLAKTYDLALVAALAVFLQTVASGKLVGFGLMTLYFVVSVALESAGFVGDLYRYGGHAETLSAAKVGTERASLVRAYWGSFALVLVIASHALYGRGGAKSIGQRSARTFGFARSPAGLVALLGLGAFLGLAVLIGSS